MTKLCQATIILDSISPIEARLTTIQTRFPRLVLSEVNTHRQLSKNAGSSRAIPIARLLKQVITNPAAPVEWGLNKPGMQADDLAYGWRLALGKAVWRSSSFTAAIHSWILMKLGFHKQIANRITEPYQFINSLWSATDWANFDVLRCHPDADPTIRELAIEVMTVLELSTPRHLLWGEWHLPYILNEEIGKHDIETLRQLSVARCARVSIAPFDGNASIKKERERFNKLIVSEPPHSSPTEHQGTPCTLETKSGNFRGWKQYRQELEEARPMVYKRGLRRPLTEDEIMNYWKKRNETMANNPRGFRFPVSPLLIKDKSKSNN